MKRPLFTAFLFAFALLLTDFAYGHGSKARVIVTTDIGGTDPDDEESMVHLLMCANSLDIEGIICQMAFCKSPIGIDRLREIIDAYGKAYPNLIVHDAAYPTADYLRSIATTGQTEVGMGGVGPEFDTPGSELIISAVDGDDPRPIWLTAWGGMNTIAQALWRVKSTRSNGDLEKFISKIRIYDVLGQCDAGAWIAKTFPEIVYIRAKDVYSWAPDDAWTKENIQKYAPMGDVYPMRRWATEGDSPSFMYLIDNGLNMPECVSAGGWGGRFSPNKVEGLRGMDWVKRNNLDEPQYDPYLMYTNPPGEATITRWAEHIRNDFAARVQWSCKPDYKDANHHPVVLLDGDVQPVKVPLFITGMPGDTINVDFGASYDPDGDPFSVRAYLYKEASDYYDDIKVDVADGKLAICLPRSLGNSTLHFIMECTDDGKPSLTSYRRIVVNVQAD